MHIGEQFVGLCVLQILLHSCSFDLDIQYVEDDESRAIGINDMFHLE